jgi:hypothetical protein
MAKSNALWKFGPYAQKTVYIQSAFGYDPNRFWTFYGLISNPYPRRKN